MTEQKHQNCYSNLEAKVKRSPHVVCHLEQSIFKYSRLVSRVMALAAHHRSPEKNTKSRDADLMFGKRRMTLAQH